MMMHDNLQLLIYIIKRISNSTTKEAEMGENIPVDLPHCTPDLSSCIFNEHYGIIFGHFLFHSLWIFVSDSQLSRINALQEKFPVTWVKGRRQDGMFQVLEQRFHHSPWRDYGEPCIFLQPVEFGLPTMVIGK